MVESACKINWFGHEFDFDFFFTTRFTYLQRKRMDSNKKNVFE